MLNVHVQALYSGQTAEKQSLSGTDRTPHSSIVPLVLSVAPPVLVGRRVGGVVWRDSQLLIGELVAVGQLVLLNWKAGSGDWDWS